MTSYLWLILALYGVVFYIISPRSRDAAGFYDGRGRTGAAPGGALLFATVFISWIFAKSVTNAANLMASFGLPGAVAYGAYWLSIPIAGIVIVAIRSRFGARSLPEWIAGRYGRAAAAGFLIAILIRLYNEVWSNTAVVAGFFGERGSAPFLAAALAFTGLTLFYTLKGGLRSSIFTDGIQAGLFGIFLVAVVAVSFAQPDRGPREVLTSGHWTLAGGVDLLLVALLQSLSYPFHDPVLTDRGFLADGRTTIRAFVLSGVLGFAAIVLFGGIGLPAFLSGTPIHDNAPQAVARALGAGFLLIVNVVILLSAGSTLDSTFSSIAKAIDRDGRGVLGATGAGHDSLRAGRFVMVGIALLGNLPLLAGAKILQATTVSGTMVIGLAPIFLLGLLFEAPAASFHLAFWTGVAIGITEAAGLLPHSLAIGSGHYAMLLGANLWGLALVSGLFLLPIALGVFFGSTRRLPSTAAG